jgi:hypothetical protein
MQSEPHIGQSAELYAAGALDAAEASAVDAHVATCDECLRRLGEAEETVLALERAHATRAARRSGAAVLPLRRRSVPSWWLAAAAAAAFIVGFVFPHAAQQGDVPTLAMIHSHFSHAQFTGTGPPAKAIYARDRSWYYVIVSGNRRYEVYGVRDGQYTDLGTTQPKQATSELFARPAGTFAALQLRDGSTIVGTVAIR